MILGPVSILDCLVAGVILAPQLVFTSGVFATLRLLYTALPLLCKLQPLRFGPGQNLALKP